MSEDTKEASGLELVVSEAGLPAGSEVSVGKTREAEALCVLADGVKALAEFVTEGGLQKLLAAHSQVQIVQAIYGGLASKEGRASLDARFIKQNVLEIVEVVEAAFNKLNERGRDRGRRDPDIMEPQE